MAKQYCRERAGLVRRRAKGLKHCTHPDNWTDNWTGNIISKEWNKAHTQTTGVIITGRVLICTHNINTEVAEKLYVREYTLGNLCKNWRQVYRQLWILVLLFPRSWHIGVNFAFVSTHKSAVKSSRQTRRIFSNITNSLHRRI